MMLIDSFENSNVVVVRSIVENDKKERAGKRNSRDVFPAIVVGQFPPVHCSRPYSMICTTARDAQNRLSSLSYEGGHPRGGKEKLDSSIVF